MNIALIGGLALAGFGLYLLAHALRSYRKAKASLLWPSVSGQMTDVTLWGKRNISGQMIDAERLAVEYRYVVKGHSFTGTVPAFYTLMYPETLDFAKTYAAGNGVKVRYNPKAPAESVVIPGPRQNKPYSDLVLATMAVMLGSAIAVFASLGAIG